MKEQYLQKQNSPYFKDQFDVKPYLYLHFERKFYHPDFITKGYLHSHLKEMRVKFKISVPHLVMILYLRMEKGENRFKDDQLELLVALYGEDVSSYKDMQDVDYLLKKIGYNDNPERAIHLLNLALRAVTIPSYDDSPKANLSSKIAEKPFNWEPFSKEIQQRKLAEIIENLHRGFQQNDVRMTEIGKKLAPMADAPNPEKTKLWQKFHQLEDE